MRLSSARKAVLLEQSRSQPAGEANVYQPYDTASPRLSPITSPFSSISKGLTRAVTQLTGNTTSSTAIAEGWSQKLSISSLGGWSSVLSPTPGSVDPGSAHAEVASLLSDRSSSNEERGVEKQSTGGLWGWWTGTNKPEEGSAEAYIQAIRDP
jgi:hypothetical protein